MTILGYVVEPLSGGSERSGSGPGSRNKPSHSWQIERQACPESPE